MRRGGLDSRVRGNDGFWETGFLTPSSLPRRRESMGLRARWLHLGCDAATGFQALFKCDMGVVRGVIGKGFGGVRP